MASTIYSHGEINHEVMHLLGLSDRYFNKYVTSVLSGEVVRREVSLPEVGWGGDAMAFVLERFVDIDASSSMWNMQRVGQSSDGLR